VAQSQGIEPLPDARRLTKMSELSGQDGAGIDNELAIIGVGASAGGLQACIKLLEAMPDDSGMAFILVQHLDPNHESLMAELLAKHTAMPVLEATNGMQILRNHVYLIPRGTYLSVSRGLLMLSPGGAGGAVRLPFDFLLISLADHAGGRVACVILSGSGSDGSLGSQAVKAKGGLVIAQSLDEAAHDGMPSSAIQTGAVDLVLPVAEIPAALIAFVRRAEIERGSSQGESSDDGTYLAEIIALLRQRTMHDFRLYKPGTLRRRIERRMAMAGLSMSSTGRYLTMLRADAAEIEKLASDLLIHVTSFFRDPNVFALLETDFIPDLLRSSAGEKTLRLWIAGCSTGQETYSLAMLFLEQIAKAKSDLRLQVFASDVDPGAVARAREGLYPADIALEMSAERLARFFTIEDHGYRVRPELRETIVFAVQDVLADPPFSRMDMISCRNLMIYLQPDAQAKVLSLFHFALREGGLLLLGNAEAVNHAEGRFETVSTAERVYRRIGRNRSGVLGIASSAGESLKLRGLTLPLPASVRQTTVAELTRQRLVETFAPASVLINSNYECLYSVGPTDIYLRVPPGHQMNNVLAMARPGMRSKLKSVLELARTEKRRVISGGGWIRLIDHSVPFGLDVQPMTIAGEELLLVCFVGEETHGEAGGEKPKAAVQTRRTQRVSELEKELEATTAELESALRDLETSSEEHRAIHEEALSVNEEFQSTNEELLTSKEELQSLNEELTALNSQLQETLERQRTMSDDLQNVLYSTDVATLFLDADFRIRFFTPASQALFRIIDGDIGRPLADLRPLADDENLLADARTVLETLTPIERETDAAGGAWFMRRILPYREHNRQVGGVVITFTDITERKRAASALDAARRQADLANSEKSRFLAAASHDLRQPLQTLALLHGLLMKAAEGEKIRTLIERQGDTIHAMSGILNTLLDINQIDAGMVQAQPVRIAISDMLSRLLEEFTYHAQAQGLVLRMVKCSLFVESDPRLLEQMLRNLLTNALKYTEQGRVLIGCRRRGNSVSIQVWDTGLGIPADRLGQIFEEYIQLDNPARERSRGLGLGLSIVRRLGRLLGHTVSVQSTPGKGSVFSIEVSRAPDGPAPASAPGEVHTQAVPRRRTGVILVVEDDPDLCEALQLCLQDEGHLAATPRDGQAALELVARGTIRPDLIIADYNLPNGLNGVQLVSRLREATGIAIPAIILTGDISSGTLKKIAEKSLPHLTKPVRLDVLSQLIQSQLPAPRVKARADAGAPAVQSLAPVVIIIDDDAQFCAATLSVLREAGYESEIYASAEAYLAAHRPDRGQCLLIDCYLPGMSGIALLERLRDAGHRHPAIVMTGLSDVPMVVKAMKAGAIDFIEKPIDGADLIPSIARAFDLSQDSRKRVEWKDSAANQIAGLTPRERQIMELVLAGLPNKIIAADLGVSQRTVEYHRAAIMRKTGAGSLPALARLAIAASEAGAGGA
jgi:two-component system CheB/CheR fusion protein